MFPKTLSDSVRGFDLLPAALKVDCSWPIRFISDLTPLFYLHADHPAKLLCFSSEVLTLVATTPRGKGIKPTSMVLLILCLCVRVGPVPHSVTEFLASVLGQHWLEGSLVY